MDNAVNKIQLDKNLYPRISSQKSTKEHDELLKSSGEILRKLEIVRQTKAYEMMKYETIARMNASSVSAYLRQQRLKPLKPNEVPQPGVDGVLQKHHEEIKNHAARIIQQFFRRITREKQIYRTLCTWRRIPLTKRVRYIEIIAERMSRGTVPRRIDHSIIKNKLDEHKKTMHANVDNYVRRKQLVKRIESDLTLLNDITDIGDLVKINPNNFSIDKQ
ncbi:unnamed protein product [Litomosoides sigmodontis]|uniref:Uncharacterized protein n=1 Tax=Litomosoides sigmodontis TaxID=42156 RepID=A0A3P6TZK8_LITSI|nr:unnamed protein product [Litomosoides sigmodontis]